MHHHLLVGQFRTCLLQHRLSLEQLADAAQSGLIIIGHLRQVGLSVLHGLSADRQQVCCLIEGVVGLTVLQRELFHKVLPVNSCRLLADTLPAGVVGRLPPGRDRHIGGSKHESFALKLAAQAAKNGVVIVRSSRIPFGGVYTEGGEVDDEKLGFIASGSLSPQKSRILLMLALTTTRDIDTIRSYFRQGVF